MIDNTHFHSFVTKRASQIRDFSRFRTTYTNARFKTLKAERSKCVRLHKNEGPNFEKSQSTNPTAMPLVMSKEKRRYFLVNNCSCFWVTLVFETTIRKFYVL